MKLLLDTRVFLWRLDDPATLSEEAASAIHDEENVVFVSAATAWEIAIKKALGKLDSPDDLGEVLRGCQFTPLAVTIEHAAAVAHLPLLHHNPVDRMLVTQTKVDGLTIVSRDANVLRYPVPSLRA
jgi:PIN domain nuclease of toxin-antitoxin system